MFVQPKMGYVRAKIGLIGQFDWRQPGNYLQPCKLCRNEIGQYAAIEFAHLKGQEPLEDCYLVLAAQSLLCNTPSWTCHVVMF